MCLVGGWWPYKDTATVDAALTRLKKPLSLLVAGTPLDQAVLERWRSLPQIRLHTHLGPVGAQELRGVYAATDAALVTRHPGVNKESGLVMDTARLGVPLVVSDHDPVLNAQLTGRSWVRLFAAGDTNALGRELDRLTTEPPTRPGPDAPRHVGMPTAQQQAAFLSDAYTRLLDMEYG